MAEASPTPASLVEEKWGAEVMEKIKSIWKTKALPKANKKMLDYFLSLGETSPQAAPCVAHTDTTADHMLDMVCKMVLYAPDVWYQVATGCDKPADAAPDFKGIGQAFDASSRLRRAGIEYYHKSLTEEVTAKTPMLAEKHVFYINSTGDTKDHFSIENLPKPASGTIRVVAVSDTHLYESNITMPRGDLLVHSGDLSYEESRSLDRVTFEKYVGDQTPDKLSGRKFENWFKKSGLALAAALKWLQKVPGFQHRVLCGGNHDYILEQLGKDSAKRLCQSYGVHYLCTEAAPIELSFKSGLSATVWGSGVSGMAPLHEGRAILSGNNAFQIQIGIEDDFKKECSHLTEGCADIMLTHCPPEGCLNGAKGKTVESVRDLILKVRPSLYVCGHSHNDINDPLKNRFADIDGILGVSAAVVATWNNFHGMPIVVDRKAKEGPIEMKVSNKKGTGFYVRAATSFLKGVPAQEASEDKEAVEAKAPLDELKISGLGEAINTAVATAVAMTKENLASISKIQTMYPDMASGRGCAQIVLTLERIK